jgi:hypothetical protein
MNEKNENAKNGFETKPMKGNRVSSGYNAGNGKLVGTKYVIGADMR